VSKTGENTGIIGVNEGSDGSAMMSEFLRKRQGFAHQTGAALAKGEVAAFNGTGLTTGFINGLMPFGGQNTGLRLPKVGGAHRPLPIVRWERVPHLLGSLFVAGTDGPPDHQPRRLIDSQPQPDLVALRTGGST